MSSEPSDHELPSGEEADWLETQFFTQPLRNHDLDWGPVTPMATGARRAMLAAIGMFAVATVGLIAFVVYANLIMPAPAPLGAAGPSLPPSAASAATPNG